MDYSIDSNGNPLQGHVDPSGRTFVATGPAPFDTAVRALSDRWANKGDLKTGHGLQIDDEPAKIQDIYTSLFERAANYAWQQPGTEETKGQYLRKLVGDHPKVIALYSQARGEAFAEKVWHDLARAALQNQAPPDQAIQAPANVIVDSEPTQGRGPLGDPPTASETATREAPSKTGGDPVILFSGQLFLQVTDLEVAGRGIGFSLVRTYANQTEYKGPLGYGWDHSYNLWLREVQEMRADGVLENILYRSNGQVRQDRYVQELVAAAGTQPPLDQIADADFRPPAGFHDRLSKINGAYRLETSAGLVIHYNADLQAERLMERNGNQMTLGYDADRRLTSITDPVGKRFDFTYDSLNRVARVRDQIGARTLHYSYGPNGDLEGVDLWPDGEAPSETDYEYSGADEPWPLQHNLLRVINPLGHVVLENAYGTDEAEWSFNRVVRQWSAGGEYHYEYRRGFDASVTGIDPALDPINFPQFATEVMGPRGHRLSYLFNGQGNPVCRSELIELDGVVQLSTSLSLYNADGNPVWEDRGDGAIISYRYGREDFADANNGVTDNATAADLAQFGLLYQRTQAPRPGVGEARRIVLRRAYTAEGWLNSERGPYFTDPMSQELPGQLVRERRFFYDARGNLVRIEHPAVTLATGGSQPQPPHRFSYDPNGRLTDVEVGGLRTRYDYYSDLAHSGFVKAKTDDVGGADRTTHFEVDLLGRVIETRSDWGAIDRQRFNGFDLLIEQSQHDPGQTPTATTFDYSVNRQLVRQIQEIRDSAGQPLPDSPYVRTFEYDVYGRLIGQSQEAAGATPRRERRVLGPDGQADRVFDALGVEQRILHNEAGQVVEVIRAFGTPDEVRERYGYEADGAICTHVDGLGYKTVITYDAFRRPQRVTNRNGTMTYKEYDAAGRIVRETVTGTAPQLPVAGRWTERAFDYDELGRLICMHQHVFEPGGPPGERVITSTISYDLLGRAIERRDPTGAMWTEAFDGLGRPTSARDPDGNTGQWIYDEVQRTVEHTETSVGIDAAALPITHVTRTLNRLDARGRLVEQVDAIGNVWRYAFDSRGLRTHEVGPAGHITRSVIDAFGERTETIHDDGGQAVSVLERYDLLGRRVGLTDPVGNVTTWTYDRRGYIATEDRGGAVRTFRYDAAGHLAVERSEDGALLTRAYTGEGQVVSVTPDLTSVTPPADDTGYLIAPTASQQFTYTPGGTISTASEGGVTVRRRYDSRDLLLEDARDGLAVHLDYDDAKQCTGIRYPDGRAVRYVYSPGGRLLQVEQLAPGANYPGGPFNGPRHLATISSVGDRIRQIEFTGSRVEFGFDAGLRPVSALWSAAPAGPVRCDERRLHGARGECRLEQVDDRIRTSLYDTLGRQTEALDFTGAATVQTAALGPASSIGGLGATSQADQDAIPRPPGQAALALRYQLDANDSRLVTDSTAPPGPPMGEKYVVGPYDRYLSVGTKAVLVDDRGATIGFGNRRFRYDAYGRLVEVDAAGVLTSLSYDGLGRLGQVTDPTGKGELVHAGDTLIEWRAGGRPQGQLVPMGSRLAQIATAGSDLTPVQDLAGSLVALLDATGGLAASTRYDPFGRILSRSATWTIPIGFASQWEASTSGLLLFPARPYDPRLGRFLNRDPRGLADGTNLYAFAHHAPAMWTDLWGHDATQHDWTRVAWTALKTAGTGLAVVGIASSLVSVGFVSAPFVATVGALWLAKSGIDSFLRHGNEAISAGVEDGAARSALAAALDMSPVPLGRAVDLALGRDFVTGRRLTIPEWDAAVGELVGGIVMAGLGPRVVKATSAPRRRPYEYVPEPVTDPVLLAAQTLRPGQQFPASVRGRRWRVGDPVNYPTPSGRYPGKTTWQNRMKRNAAHRGEPLPLDPIEPHRGTVPIDHIMPQRLNLPDPHNEHNLWVTDSWLEHAFFDPHAKGHDVTGATWRWSDLATGP